MLGGELLNKVPGGGGVSMVSGGETLSSYKVSRSDGGGGEIYGLPHD